MNIHVKVSVICFLPWYGYWTLHPVLLWMEPGGLITQFSYSLVIAGLITTVLVKAFYNKDNRQWYWREMLEFIKFLRQQDLHD